jgi:site-specific recombinase XerD
LAGIKRVKKALSKAELKILHDAHPRTQEQQKARDFFFFSYSCNGMNIKDIALLKTRDLQADTFKFIRAKTINSRKESLSEVVVYLSTFAKEVLLKYGNKMNGPDDFVFPILLKEDDSQKRRSKIQGFTKFINTHLKKLAIAEGLTGDISTYFARHSFASNAIRQGASMEFVMEALSHNNIQTTKGYFAGFEDEAKKEIMEGLMNF